MSVVVPLCCLTLLLLCAIAPALAFQAAPAGSRTRPSQKQPSGRMPTYAEDLTATFSGTVRTNEGKMLRIEDPDNKLLEFHCTHRTEYFDGEKKIKASALKPGMRVSVDAKQFPNGELDPVAVRVIRETKKPPVPADDDVLRE